MMPYGLTDAHCTPLGNAIMRGPVTAPGCLCSAYTSNRSLIVVIMHALAVRTPQNANAPAGRPGRSLLTCWHASFARAA